MIINKTIQIDFQRNRPPQVIEVMQNDALTRSVSISLLDGGEPWAVPEGVTASLAYRLLCGDGGWYDTLPDGSAACAVEGSTVTAILAPQVLARAGTVTAALVLQDASLNQLSTFGFQLNVKANPAAGESVSNVYYNLRTLGQINSAVEEIRARLDALEKSGLPALGDAYEGQMLYVSGGVLVPLRLGPGLSIRDGVLYVSGGAEGPEEAVGTVTASVDEDGGLHVYLDGAEIEPVVDDDGDLTWPGLELVLDENGNATLQVKEDA